MKWRTVQLGNDLCKQDKIILDLFATAPVRYIGNDNIFAKNLNIDQNSSDLILIVNDNVWLSELAQIIKTHLSYPTNTFYIGINRYRILGNDTNRNFDLTESYGLDIIAFIKTYANKMDYTIEHAGSFDNDRGRYFNFVQPLTWVYGKKSNSSH